jgi:hypothetical protein
MTTHAGTRCFRQASLVWHQRDERTSLLIGAAAYDTVGMDHAEGRIFPGDVLDCCTQDHFIYLHEWIKGRHGDVQ